MTDKSMRVLWQDYLFLTQELNRFVSADNIDLLSDLLRQRAELAAIIQTTAEEEDYIKSYEAQVLLKKIAEIDKSTFDKLLTARNFLQKNMELNVAYDGLGEESIAVGTRFDSSGK